MLFAIESARALFYRAISEAEVDAPLEAVQRARAAHVTVQRAVAVVAVTQEAIHAGAGRGRGVFPIYAAICRPIRTVFVARRPPHPAVNSAVSSVGVLSIG
jgi:hypothetical protein